MDASIKQLISEEAAKIIVKYNFEKSNSDSKSVIYLAPFDQNILAANNITLIRAPFGVQLSVYKEVRGVGAHEQLGVGISVNSNYTLKQLPDSSWDDILTNADQAMQTYFTTGKSSYYTDAMDILQDGVVNWLIDEFNIKYYKDLSRGLSRNIDKYFANFKFTIPTSAWMDLALIVFVKKDIKFELNTSIVARASESFGLKDDANSIKTKFSNINRAIEEINKLTNTIVG